MSTFHCSLSQFNSGTTKTRKIPAWLLARIAAENEIRFCPQKYTSVIDFFRTHNLTTVSKKGPPWRLTSRLVGSIQGLPQSFGHLTATNGILCYIENHTGVYQGHLAWFEKVELEEEPSANPTMKTTKHRSLRRYSANEVDILLE